MCLSRYSNRNVAIHIETVTDGPYGVQVSINNGQLGAKPIRICGYSDVRLLSKLREHGSVLVQFQLPAPICTLLLGVEARRECVFIWGF